MEKTLEEMLYDLQCFTYRSIDLCKLRGNSLGEPWWRIEWINTAGGEKFVFFQMSMGMRGSGIYFDTREEALSYAKECVVNLFKTSAFDANDYDWRPRLMFEET